MVFLETGQTISGVAKLPRYTEFIHCFDPTVSNAI